MVDDASHDIGDRCPVALGHDDPGAAAQKLDRAGKGRRDDGTTTGDRVDEDAGGDLVLGVVRGVPRDPPPGSFA